MSKQIEFGDRNGGSWGTIKVGRKGFTIESHSRWIGSRTGSVVFVPFMAQGLAIRASDDLSADYCEGMSIADALRNFAASFEDRCVVRRRGIVVQ